MRVLSFLSPLLFLSSLLLFVAAETETDTAEPIDQPEDYDDGAEIAIGAVWPENNPFGHIVNGEKNTINIVFESKTDKNVTVLNVGGSVHHPETDVLIKNLTVLTFGLPMIKGAKIQLPYSFYSEFKPGDLKLHVWVEHAIDGEKDRSTGYESIVSVVEPEKSIFDFQLLSTYLIVIGIFGGLGYLTYVSLVPQPKKSRRANPASVSGPVGSVTATGAGGYQEEWIPEHHLRKSNKKKSGNATSGDELSGGETSGAEAGKKRSKARK